MAIDDRPPTLPERYAGAVHASSLASEERSWRSPSDVLGAYGLAHKHLTTGWRTTGKDGEGHSVKPAPLAVPLERLLAGDGKAAHEIVAQLADMAWHKARALRVKMPMVKAADLARSCLAWFRDGRCNECGGHGYSKVPGTPQLSERECEHCKGTGKLLLEDLIDPSKRDSGLRDLARWLVAEMTRETGRAGEAAMAAIAPRLEL